MAIQAKITSLEALESFRSHLIVFMAKGRRALDDVGDEVRRTREWLHHNQRSHWENEIRTRSKKLEQAEQELLSAKLTGHKEAALVRQATVNKWKAAVAEAQAKLRVTKQWSVQYDSVADPIFKRLDDLRQYLELDVPQATAFLANTQKTLESYSESPIAPSEPPQS